MYTVISKLHIRVTVLPNIFKKPEILDQGKHIFDFITEVYSKIEDAKKMSKLIETYKILKPTKMELTQGEKKDTLETRKIKQLITKGLLPLIYSHLFSLNNRY